MSLLVNGLIKHNTNKPKFPGLLCIQDSETIT